MKKIFSVLMVLIISCNTTIAISQSAIGNAVIRVFDKSIPLYNKSHEIIDTIVCDIDKDLLYSVSIFKIKNNYAYIHASCVVSDIFSIEKEGWIKLEYLGINPANCSNGLILRKRPSNNAKVKSNILNPRWGDLYPIKKAYRRWLYIETIIDDTQYSGWISPEQQCSNPYSSCC